MAVSARRGPESARPPDSTRLTVLASLLVSLSCVHAVHARCRQVITNGKVTINQGVTYIEDGSRGIKYTYRSVFPLFFCDFQ